MVGLLAILLAMAMFLAMVLFAQLKFQEVKERTQVYLCLKYLIVQTQKHIRFIGNLNRSIVASHSFSLIPLPGMAAVGEKMRRALKTLQMMDYFSYMKKLVANDYCLSTQGLGFLQNVPYQTRGRISLARKEDGTTIVREKKWRVVVKRGSIVLETIWILKNALESTPELSTREFFSVEGVEGGRFWNPLSGVP